MARFKNDKICVEPSELSQKKVKRMKKKKDLERMRKNILAAKQQMKRSNRKQEKVAKSSFEKTLNSFAEIRQKNEDETLGHPDKKVKKKTICTRLLPEQSIGIFKNGAMGKEVRRPGKLLFSQQNEARLQGDIFKLLNGEEIPSPGKLVTENAEMQDDSSGPKSAFSAAKNDEKNTSNYGKTSNGRKDINAKKNSTEKKNVASKDLQSDKTKKLFEDDDDNTEDTNIESLPMDPLHFSPRASKDKYEDSQKGGGNDETDGGESEHCWDPRGVKLYQELHDKVEEYFDVDFSKLNMTGYYLYIEASGRLTNDTARIISPLYNASYTDSRCFSFWYHMFGAGIGALRVYLKEESTETPKLMFEKRGDQDNRWLHGLFDLPKTNSSFQIIIEGVRGINYVSDIAIDDVAILQADECTQARRIDSDTTVRSVTDDDQIEIINALQSCRGRCGNIPGINTWTTIIPLSSPDACQCSLECAENSTCCPDFAEYCILAVTDYPLSASTNEELNPTTKLNPLIITIDTKDEIDPEASNPPRKLSSPVTAKLTTSELATTVKTRIRTTDKALHPETPFPTTLRHESPPRTTESSTVKIASKTTDLSINTISSESDVLVGRVAQLQAAVSFGLSEIISIVVVLIAAVAIATGIIIVVLRRRKTYKRGSGSSGSILSEDSDVRFLTSDEVLDFNLARPNEYDEI
ncbi:uncharacterized protein LOC141528275 isoform X6 [Cotesia typhae]|uniref:uncharacterized protein LOC141528275 isoform X6 n=1 Tax=Cotesia typhae TaxID=2053667 RepID=UPI003D69352B